ncbi:phosphate metabolism protein 7 [Coemansia sp. RSA 1853]|nr:phosphate metabolism protein 7 [Coemansia sp. RSA 638]KAJ2541677.1 phosphate metabolism protein 7 [Coemansia sp. RSA 1853]
MDAVVNATSGLIPSSDSDDTKDTSNSVVTFLASLTINIAVALLIFVIFCILRPRLRRVYAPRTYAVTKDKRPEPVSRGLFSWIPAVLRVPDTDIIQQSGLDTYMFLRSIRTMFIMFGVISIASAASILPVNVLGTMKLTGLNSLSMGNVDPRSNWLWVHIGFFAAIVWWSLWNIVGELRIYTHLRMWWLTHPNTVSKAGASTVLVSNVPKSLANDESRLRDLFSMFPGGIRQVFVNRMCKKLAKTVHTRDKLVTQLEKELTKYAIKCKKLWSKSQDTNSPYRPPSRPTARKGWDMFAKVDLFEHLAAEIARCNRFIAKSAKNMDTMERQSSALVMFNQQVGAHMAAQTVLDYRPFSMGQVTAGVNPDDIIWSNLEISPWSRRIRGYVTFAITVGLTLLWTIIAAALSSLVQVKSLADFEAFKWLRGNSVVLGIFSGVVPSLVLALLMSILPNILRLLLYIEGTTTRSQIKLRMLHRLFFFQTWNVYLVTIFSSSIFQIAIKSVSEPGKIVELIQTQVPQSATNILTYVLLLAFIGAAKEIVQGVPLALRYLVPKLFAKTPRMMLKAEQPQDFKWEAAIPTHSLIFLMGFSYSFIAPIVNWFVMVYFGLFYLIYRYQFLYVYNDSTWATGGLSFPKSIKQMLVSIYISEVYLLLMMVAKLHAGVNAIMRIVVAAGLIAVTVGAHLYINEVYMPAINHLPVKRAADVERTPVLAREFPDVLDRSGDIEKMLPESQRCAYATFSSLVPAFVIKLVLRLTQSAKPNAVDNGWDDAEETRGFAYDDQLFGQRQTRLSMADWQPLATSSNAYLARQFASPELRARAVSNLWVPLGDVLFEDLRRDIEHHGQGTILFITQGTDITKAFKVHADTDFELDHAESSNRADLYKRMYNTETE